MCRAGKLAVYIEKQLEEMLGPFNRWVTGIAVGHNPTNDECIWNYIKNGGTEDFARRWKDGFVH